MTRTPIPKAQMPAPTRPSVALTCVLAWVFPGAGHMLHWDAPEALAAVLVDFFQSSAV